MYTTISLLGVISFVTVGKQRERICIMERIDIKFVNN